jgi:hypothetical protein
MPFLIQRNFLEKEIKLAERHLISPNGGNKVLFETVLNILSLLPLAFWFHPMK